MTRRAKYGLMAGLGAVLIVTAWAAAWIGGTTDGARWLMDAVSRHTPLAISARAIEGRLLGDLRLRGVHLALAPVEAEIESLDFRWQPLRLFTGSIAARELTLAGVAIRDNSPGGKPPDLTWPRVSGIAGLFDAEIGRLEVNGLIYRLPDGGKVSLRNVSSSVLWRKAFLSLSDLVIVAPAGRVAGSVAAGFLQPLLRFDLALTPVEPIAGLDAFTLQARLSPGTGGEQLAGGISAAGVAGTVKRWELAGEVGMTPQAFNLRRLRLTRPGRRGVVSGEGKVTLTAGEPFLALEVKAADLDLSHDTGVAADLSGTLTLTGTPGRYRGEFAIDTRGKGWRTARLAGAYAGDGEGVNLAPLTGALLGGTLRGDLAIRWRDEVSLEGTVRGRMLNPSAISADWAGVVNFDLSGNIRQQGQAPLRGRLSAKLLESRLHGQALTGEVDATLESGDLHIGRLLLRGKGFAITAAGDLGERLAFAAEVGDLGRMIPRASGELAADGWVRWRDGRLDGSVTGRGTKLAAGGMRIAAANMTARFGEEKGRPLHVAGDLRDVAYDGLRADSITLAADGTVLRHTVDAALRAPGVEARIVLGGAYDRGAWRGEIVRFSGRDGLGPWSLAAPAALSVAAGRATLAPLVLRGTGTEPERLEVAGEFTREPPIGSIRAAWSGLNLARANPWLSGVRVAGTSAGDIRVRFPEGERPEIAGSASARGTLTEQKYGIAVEQGTLSFDGGEKGTHAAIELHAAGGGMLKGSFSSPTPARLAVPQTGDMTAEWTGIDLTPFRRWLPVGIGIEGRLAGRMTGKLLPGERLDLRGGIALAGGKIRWQEDGDAVAADLQTAELTWGWQGALPASGGEIGAGRLVAAGRVGASGILTLDGHRIGVEQGSLNLDGSERGLHARLELALAGGGSLKGRFSSPRPAGLAIPAEGEVDLEWGGIDVLLFRPWLPPAVTLDGRLAGRASGSLFPEKRFALKGESTLTGATIRWLRPEGEMNAALRSASVSWEWRGETLRGDAALTLSEYGQARGSFDLPLPARFPVAFDRRGALRASLTAQVREKGLLSGLFPGVIRESHGDLDGALKVGGTWEAPEVGGSLKLTGAGAYLPSAGIQVKEIELAVRLENGLIQVDSFRAASGPGHIEGTARVRLKGWRVADYEGSVTGERFQTVYFPEVQILCAPRIQFEGTPEKLTVRGELRLPEIIILGPPTRAVVVPSGDVIVEGAPKPVEKAFPLALDIQVRLVLGEKVLVKTEGIDAQLGGSIDLTLHSLERITSKGEIRVVKGRYKAYGADLEIVRGRLYYAGGPISQPTLDILALRTVGDVRAGITAGGVLRAPAIKLYSEPAMPDVDILSYILFGHPFSTGSNAEQAGRMVQVAGAILSQGQASALQDQIMSRLGLSTLEIQSRDSSGLMGYKQITATPTGAAQAKTTDSASQTLLTVGTYLVPQLYFSYGRSFSTGGNLFRIRYDLSKRWQIETQTGSASSVDLYFKIDFE